MRGPDAERFTDYVITRDATRIEPMHAKYVILCNERGGILNDPVLLRLSEDEFWFSLADSDLLFWLQGVNVGMKMDVEIDEIDVCPVQIQGPKSIGLMADLVGEGIRDIPYYGLMEAEIGGCPVVISQSGFSGEKGYEIYLRDATLHAEKLWYAGCSRRARPTSSWSSPRATNAASRPVSCPGGRTSTTRRRPSSATSPTRSRAASGATTSAGRRSSACARRSIRDAPRSR